MRVLRTGNSMETEAITNTEVTAVPTPPLDWKDLYDNMSSPDTVLGVITILGGVLFMLKKALNAIGLDVVKKDGSKVNTWKVMKDLEPRVVKLESTIVGIKGCEERQRHCQEEIGKALMSVIERADANGETSQANAVTLGEVKTNIEWIKTAIQHVGR